MGIEILFAGALSAFAGLVTNIVANLLAKEPQLAETWYGRLLLRLGFRPKGAESFSDRLTRLTTELSRASAEVDETLKEIGSVAAQRQQAVQNLEIEMSSLAEKERELKGRITALEGVSLPAVEHFVKLSAPGERRSAWRDYLLFLAGVIVSTLAAIVLNRLGLA